MWRKEYSNVQRRRSWFQIAAEARACGTAIIATHDGAIPEIVIHEKTGFICDSIQEMIDAVNKIHTIDALACHKRGKELSIQNMAKNYEKLYYKIIEGNEW